MRLGSALFLLASLSCTFGCRQGATEANLQPDLEAERAARQENYRQAIAKLTAPGAAGRDEELCKGLAAILAEASARDDPTLHVAIVDSVDPDVPPADWVSVEHWRKQASNRLEPLPQKLIFSDDSADKRREMIFEMLQRTFMHATGADVVKLVVLAAGTPRSGKSILDIQATTHRGDYCDVRFVNAVYLFREFNLDWKLSLVNDKEAVLASFAAQTEPGPLNTAITLNPEERFDTTNVLGRKASSLQLEAAFTKFEKLLGRKLGAGE